MNRYSKLSIVAAGLAAAGTAAFAAQKIENDEIAINNAKISLVQAISAAEQHSKGRASRAEYEKSKQGWVYDVEVVSGAKVFDVKVDADKGSVIAATEDKADKDDEHDEQD
jgi:uncharacterized membrane protein YkoI